MLTKSVGTGSREQVEVLVFVAISMISPEEKDPVVSSEIKKKFNKDWKYQKITNSY